MEADHRCTGKRSRVFPDGPLSDVLATATVLDWIPVADSVFYLLIALTMTTGLVTTANVPVQLLSGF